MGAEGGVRVDLVAGVVVVGLAIISEEIINHFIAL